MRADRTGFLERLSHDSPAVFARHDNSPFAQELESFCRFVDVRPAHQRALAAGENVRVFDANSQVFPDETGLDLPLLQLVFRQLFVPLDDFPVVYPLLRMKLVSRGFG